MRRKVGQLAADLIGAGPQVRQEVLTLASREPGLNGIRIQLLDGDGHSRKGAALFVDDGAAKRGQRRLGLCRRSHDQERHADDQRGDCVSKHFSPFARSGQRPWGPRNA